MVDRALASARARTESPDFVLRDMAMVVVSCTEALVRQIRDADDTQFTAASEMREVLNDSTVVVAERIAEAVAARPEGKGRW